jgi:hypothetical protein
MVGMENTFVVWGKRLRAVAGQRQIQTFRRTRDLLLLRLLSGRVELSAETRTN